MSAVSSESAQPESAQPESAHSGSTPQPADFGANEWLVEELYQRYLADPGSVDRAWWSFFADYQPALANGTGPQPVISVAKAAAAPPAPPAAPAPPAPAQVAAPAPAPAPVAPAPAPVAPAPAPAAPPAVPGAEVSRLRGAAARTVTNMTASLSVPTATSVR